MKQKNKFKCMLSLIFLLSLIFSMSCSKKDVSEKPKEEKKVYKTNTVHPLEEDHVILDEKLGSGYINNIIVVFVKEGVEDEEVLSWFPGEEPRIEGRFPGMRQLQVRIQPRSKEELELLANKLMEKEEVLYSHIDLAATTVDQSMDNPEENPEEEGIYPETPTKDKPENEWWYDVVGLKEAQKYIPKDKLVKVGVVDDGFDTQHPDLQLEFISKEHSSKNSPEAHGTHVAGIVQQILPGAKITVTDSYRTPADDPFSHVGTLCNFMKYMVDMVEADVKVLNYSMGGDITEDDQLPWNVEVCSVTSVYLWLLQQQGHKFMIVQSAGNVGIDAYRNGVFCTLNQDNCLGSKEARVSLGVSKNIEEAQKRVFDSIVVVGGAQKDEEREGYKLLEGTNYGDLITVVAPGFQINSTYPGGYFLMGGTSQAAPIVSGALGLLWSLDPNLEPGELKDILVKSASHYVYDELWKTHPERREKYPMIDILGAVKAVIKKQ